MWATDNGHMRKNSLFDLRRLFFTVALVAMAGGMIGCGDQNNTPANNLNQADLMYLRQQEYQQMYGGNSSTQTVTAVSTTVINVVSTVGTVSSATSTTTL
jgi:hypothetical protein